MMRKFFGVAFVAATILFVCPPHGASARSTQQAVLNPEKDGAAHWTGETGQASFYGPAYHGRRSASGARFDQMALTAAHPWLPFGTKVKVILTGTSRAVIVTITDRIYSTHRIVDLSLAAARALGMINRGVAEVTLVPA